jgi:hypothetical protein
VPSFLALKVVLNLEAKKQQEQDHAGNLLFEDTNNPLEIAEYPLCQYPIEVSLPLFWWITTWITCGKPPFYVKKE